jgi:hypothetical protein
MLGSEADLYDAIVACYQTDRASKVGAPANPAVPGPPAASYALYLFNGEAMIEEPAEFAADAYAVELNERAPCSPSK